MVAFSKTKKYKNRGGSNIGSNCNDPNFSIYNTNMLKLFPYKGGKAIPPESNMELLRTPEGLELEEQQRLEDERQRLEDEDVNDMDNSINISEHFNNISENSYDLNDSDDIRRQNIQNDFIRGENIHDDNSIHYLDDSEMEPLNLSDLGGGLKQKKTRKSKKSRKGRKSKKSRKSRKGKKGKKSKKSRKRKGGKLYLDDQYKNSEGPQY
jgi:hypothetical protein